MHKKDEKDIFLWIFSDATNATNFQKHSAKWRFAPTLNINFSEVLPVRLILGISFRKLRYRRSIHGNFCDFEIFLEKQILQRKTLHHLKCI